MYQQGSDLLNPPVASAPIMRLAVTSMITNQGCLPRGDQQQAGFNYEDVFTPMAAVDTLLVCYSEVGMIYRYETQYWEGREQEIIKCTRTVQLILDVVALSSVGSNDLVKVMK